MILYPLNHFFDGQGGSLHKMFVTLVNITTLFYQYIYWQLNGFILLTLLNKNTVTAEWIRFGISFAGQILTFYFAKLLQPSIDMEYNGIVQLNEDAARAEQTKPTDEEYHEEEEKEQKEPVRTVDNDCFGGLDASGNFCL